MNQSSLPNPLSPQEIRHLYFNASDEDLKQRAAAVTEAVHGKAILLRGLIEYSNYCRENCLYCGIRAANSRITRYRLTEEQIVNAALDGVRAGLRTVVLQGGEDGQFSCDALCKVISRIKRETQSNCAITLSAGAFERSELAELKTAGADRYLLRFETATLRLHQFLRNGRSLESRLTMLEHLRELGYQVGSGFMVGLPDEDDDTRIDNILLAQQYQLDMVGIGPFIPHPDTPIGNATQHSIDMSLRCVSLLRLALPLAHIPATTAAGSLDPEGRERMIAHGANVLMPNLTPVEVKPKYLLYPGKICLDETGSQCIGCMGLRVKSVNRHLCFDRGDALRPAIPHASEAI